MTFKEINKKFTEMVMEYMVKGYTINAGTMEGTQGETAKIDLTDGKEVIRIMIDGFYEGDWRVQFEGFEIIVGRCTDRVRINRSGHDIIWSEHLEILSEEKFYKLGCHGEWFGTKDEAIEVREKQSERFKRTGYEGFGWNQEKDLTTDMAVNIVIPFIRRELGLKKVRRNDIEVWKYRNGDRRQYRVLYGAKTLVLD